MSLVLPSTVEELNYLQSTQYAIKSQSNKGFENITTVGYKREVSLPDGVNWNVIDYETYLNFEENNTPGNNFKVNKSHDDSIVPGEGEIRQRSESFSSVTSSMDDKSLVYHNLGVKTFNTVCMDSGSTCISSEHSYVSPSPTLFKGLEDEETYQNLTSYMNKGPEIHPTDSLSSISPASSPADNSNLEYSVLNNFSMIGNCSQDGFSEISVGSKRSADTSMDDDDLFLIGSSKRSCESPNGTRYHEIRKKNNIASKNCRKTRKEKQKEMEVRLAELGKERDELNATIELLQKMIDAHHVHLCTILHNRQSTV